MRFGAPLPFIIALALYLLTITPAWLPLASEIALSLRVMGPRCCGLVLAMHSLRPLRPAEASRPDAMGMASAFAVWGWAGTLSLARVPGTPLCSPVEMMRMTPR